MDLQEAIKMQNDLALSLTTHILQAESKDTNFIFSLLSIHVVLSLIATSSSCTTLQQILSLLRCTLSIQSSTASVDQLSSFASQVVDFVFADGSPKGGPHLSVANGLWLDTPLTLKHSFKQMVDDVYKAACMQADFQNKPAQVIREVNSWCEKETRGLIKEILTHGSVKSETRLILANALCFKGAWKDKFHPLSTRDDDFSLANGSSVEVPFMTSLKRQMACSHSGFKVLGLPYEQGLDNRRFTMYFFLPDTKDGLPALVEKLSSESGFLERHLPFQSVLVNLKIPRFKTEFKFEASNILKRLGVVAAFQGGLTEMVDSPLGNYLFVGSVFQKAFIAVNEEGTEAAAASAFCIHTGCGFGVKIFNIVADHPFLYLIREDETGVVLFVGHLLNPLQGCDA